MPYKELIKKKLSGFLKSLTPIEAGISFFFWTSLPVFFPFTLGGYLEVPTGYHREKKTLFLKSLKMSSQCTTRVQVGSKAFLLP
jgi:hypothetical protein